jgi:hypothetical protein
MSQSKREQSSTQYEIRPGPEGPITATDDDDAGKANQTNKKGVKYFKNHRRNHGPGDLENLQHYY